VPPQPTPAPPATSQPRSSHAPNATIRRQAEPTEREISPEAWDDYVAGFRVGNEKHLGVQIGTVVEQHATILEPAEHPGVSFTEPNGPL